jgi:hypothetical protein
LKPSTLYRSFRLNPEQAATQEMRNQTPPPVLAIQSYTEVIQVDKGTNNDPDDGRSLQNLPPGRQIPRKHWGDVQGFKVHSPGNEQAPASSAALETTSMIQLSERSF